MKYAIGSLRLSDMDKEEYLKKGLYVYDLRDGHGQNYTIEPFVLINHIGIIITDEPIDFALATHGVSSWITKDLYFDKKDFTKVYKAKEVTLEQLEMGLLAKKEGKK
jgi:hypothetical protein